MTQASKVNGNRGRMLVALAAIAAAGAGVAALPAAATATTYAWNGSGTSWASSTSWTPNGLPGSADTASFNLGGSQTVDLNGNQAADEISVGSGTLTIQGGSGSYNLALGSSSGGNIIYYSQGAGSPITIGSATPGEAVNVNLAAVNGNQTIVDDSTSALTFENDVSGTAATNNITILNVATNSSSSGAVYFNGVLSDGAAGGLLSLSLGVPASVIYLNGANTFTGGISIYDTVNVASLSDYGVASAIGARTASQDTNQVGPGSIGLYFSGGTLQYTGSTAQSTDRQIRLTAESTNTIDASGSNSSATISFTYTGTNTNLYNAPGPRTLNLVGSNTGRNTFSIGLTDQASNGGQTSLVKAGAGTWVLNNPSGGNTYSGATSVNAGTLIVDSAIDSSPFTVASGATLAGDGSVGTLTASSGGILSPGDGSNGSTMDATGGTALANGGILDFALGSPNVAGGTAGSSLLKTTTLSLGTGITVNIATGAGFGPGTYSLLDYTGALTDNSSGFSGWTASGLPIGDTYAFSLGSDQGTPSVQLTISAIPEPATLGLMAAGGLGILLRPRKRRGKGRPGGDVGSASRDEAGTQ